MVRSSVVHARAFTLIELLVAIGVSVVLLSILAFVFKISAGATRDATTRVSLIERTRLLNMRVRQEVAGMDDKTVRLMSGTTTPYTDKRTYDLDITDPINGSKWFMFTTNTIENGRRVKVDVKYELVEDAGGDYTKSALVRWRDKTAPFIYDSGNHRWDMNPKYCVGDDEWVAPTSGSYDKADVLVTNVRYARFNVVDPPAGMPGSTTAPSPSELNPRLLPAAVQLIIDFGPEQGNLEMGERMTMTFLIPRGQ